MKSNDTRERAQLLLHAYLEALVGAFALRHPNVAEAVRKHAPRMSLESSYPTEHVNLHADVLVNELAGSLPKVQAAFDQITNAFVAGMWDTLRSHAHYDRIATNPDVQFFRHLRNACGHDGKWNFTELKHLARWRDKELTLAHADKVVFGGLLKHGDVFLLMKDIDSTYFSH